MIETKDFSKRFVGYNIVDCAVRRRDFFYFIAREDYTQWTDWKDTGDHPNERSLHKRVMTFVRSKEPAQQWGHCVLKQFSRLSSSVALLPKEQLIVGSLSGQIFVLGAGEDEIQNEVKPDLRGSLSCLRTIDGHVYLAGSGRTAGVRRGKNDWQWLTRDTPYDKEKELYSAGFETIDGFSSDDIYAAGGEGDVWHFNGTAWRRVDFPKKKLSLETICCGGDGRVYISGDKGKTFVGRYDSWKKVEMEGELSLAFKDMVWYEDRVWCTNDYGVWWIIDDQLLKADIPAFAKISAGNLSARDGVLLLAGFYGAAYLENGQWNQIFSYHEMVDRCIDEDLYDGVLQARWHEFED